MSVIFDDDERESQEEEEEEQDSSSQGDKSSSDSSEDKGKDKATETEAESEADSDDDDFYDRDRALSTIKKLRDEVKEGRNAQKELDRLTKAQKARERKDQSELEQVRSDLEEKDTELSTLRSENTSLKNRIQRSAFIEQIGYDQRIARQAWNSLEDAGAEPEFDDKWRLTNKKVVHKALKDYDADLFGTGRADGGKRERNSEGSNTDMNDLIRQGFGR